MFKTKCEKIGCYNIKQPKHPAKRVSTYIIILVPFFLPILIFFLHNVNFWCRYFFQTINAQFNFASLFLNWGRWGEALIFAIIPILYIKASLADYNEYKQVGSMQYAEAKYNYKQGRRKLKICPNCGFEYNAKKIYKIQNTNKVICPHCYAAVNKSNVTRPKIPLRKEYLCMIAVITLYGIFSIICFCISMPSIVSRIIQMREYAIEDPLSWGSEWKNEIVFYLKGLLYDVAITVVPVVYVKTSISNYRLYKKVGPKQYSDVKLKKRKIIR